MLRKLRRKKSDEPQPTPLRITNDTVVEHRERILAGGRRFKYPLQYARHKLVINTIVLSFIALILLVTLGWFHLYKWQNTGDFIYRVTKVIPVPVAYIDGEPVRYSDYLVRYRGSAHYLERKEQANLASADVEDQLIYFKQQAMRDALIDAYAAKLARERNIKVTDEELELVIERHRQQIGDQLSDRAYDAVALDYYNWSPEELRERLRATYLRQKVAYAVDEIAKKQVEDLRSQVSADGSDFRSIVESYNSKNTDTITFGSSGWVPHSNQDGGLATVALSLQKGQVSSVFESSVGDGYYFIRLLDRDASRVNYEYVKIPLRVFDREVVALIDTGSEILIDIPKADESVAPPQQQ